MLFVENKKELETLSQIKKIYSQYIRMKFGFKNVPCWEWKVGKKQLKEDTC